MALTFLGLYSVRVLLRLRGGAADAVDAALIAIYCVFVVDFVARCYLADPRGKWFLTAMGRLVAVTLMLGGITLLGIITATMASWIVQRVSEEDTANQAATRAQIEELREEIRRLAGDGPAYGEGREGN